jgi:hypothetical protein
MSTDASHGTPYSRFNKPPSPLKRARGPVQLPITGPVTVVVDQLNFHCQPHRKKQACLWRSKIKQGTVYNSNTPPTAGRVPYCHSKGLMLFFGLLVLKYSHQVKDRGALVGQ